MKRASLLAVCFLFTLACNGDKVPTTPATTPVPSVTSVGLSLLPLIPTIQPGQTARLLATARYSDGSNKDVTSQATWTTTDARVATVSAGAVTGVALGFVVIRVNFEQWSTFETIVIKPDGAFSLSGRVTEAGGVGVAGATVEVIGGTPNQTMTSSAGDYRLFVIGTSILRFGKTGYFDERRTVTMTADQALNVGITPRFPPANVAGAYRVTFTASASCTSLPAELKTRTYTARIDQDAIRLLVTLSGASFVSKQNTFSGKVSGDTVTFELGGNAYYYNYGGPLGPLVQEMLSNGQILGIVGTITAPLTLPSLSGPLVGTFNLSTGATNRVASCSADDNQAVFTRQ